MQLDSYTEAAFCQPQRTLLKRFFTTVAAEATIIILQTIWERYDSKIRAKSSSPADSAVPQLAHVRADSDVENRSGTARLSRYGAPAGNSRGRSRHESFRQPRNVRGAGEKLDYFRQHSRTLPVVPRGSALGEGSSQRRSWHPPSSQQRMDHLTVGTAESGGQSVEPAGCEWLSSARYRCRHSECQASRSRSRA